MGLVGDLGADFGSDLRRDHFVFILLETLEEEGVAEVGALDCRISQVQCAATADVLGC